MAAMPEREARRIVRDPQICGGDPTMAGTRIPVHSIVIQWGHYHDVSRLISAFPRLETADIEAALAFYEAHRAEIDGLIEENERAAYAAD